jgi:hypothetical protein
MTTSAVVVLLFLCLAAVLLVLRGVGVGYRTWDLGWLGLAIFAVLGVILTLTGAVTF